MALGDAVAAWPKLTTGELMWNVVLVFLLVQIGRFLYGGVRIRWKFRQLQAQGIVSIWPLEPHLTWKAVRISLTPVSSEYRGTVFLVSRSLATDQEIGK